ncbi:T9SS type A sorting domain-containing protein [Pontibacter beigongshangensis]|uniref:T9SS type A sorting domain-containing protein n=1 Tax=Pontibacter beigongshangensis TaxID=2574733 RepID=UPI00293BC46A|nr:T9SS type A sorting domain-containing protein [Pontibacter beigongshangensis]
MLHAQQLAFPGAEGFGRFTTGGRGGSVIEVTNLNDSGAGSLRAAVMAAGARTVVFRVSGTIALKSRLSITVPNLTIAGQTAPGDGITIKDYPVVINADNVIIRYLRFRMGDEANQEADALEARFRKNIIIDHCSMSWSTDECVSLYANENTTLQWCLIAESLRNSAHAKGAHGYGGVWGGRYASFHHNLLAHHDSRNPRLGEEAGKAFALTDLTDVRNNIIFNWGGNSMYGGEAMNVNIVNNYYKPGPATSKGERIISIDKNKNQGTEVYDRWGKFFIDGNFVEGSTRATNDNWTYGVYNQFHGSYGTVPEADKQAMRMSAPHPIEGNVTTHTAQEAYELVLEKTGASLVRDAVDLRIIENVRNKTFTANGSNGSTKGIIDSQNDVGGWPELQSLPAPADTDRDGMPDAWETEHSLDPNNPADRNGDFNGDGYTNLEKYLHAIVAAGTTTSSPEGAQLAEANLYPNPFAVATTFAFVTKQQGQAQVTVSDITGKQVATLLNKPLTPGAYSVNWNGTDTNGNQLTSGMYFISLRIGEETSVKRVALIRE